MKKYQTRIIAALQSGRALVQDFYTDNYLLALVQFGAGNTAMLETDPTYHVSWIYLIGQTGDAGDDAGLTQIYIEDMLNEQIQDASIIYLAEENRSLEV